MPKKIKPPIKFTFPGEASQLADVRAHARNFLQGSRFDEESTARIVMALDEACTNIIRHAQHGESKPIKLEMRWLKNRLRLTLRDFGSPCDPESIKAREWDEDRPGGLGVAIIQKVFDRVEYAPQSRGTRLTLEKSLPTAIPQSCC